MYTCMCIYTRERRVSRNVPFKIAREPPDEGEGDPDFFLDSSYLESRGRGGGVRVSSIVPRGNFRGIDDVWRLFSLFLILFYLFINWI